MYYACVVKMKIYSYVVRYDDGAAPNPFWGFCTLAICKPVIRCVAEVGDWVIGTGSKENVGNNKLIYAMKITEKMRLEDYGRDKRFKKKIPVGREGIRSLGDNIYYRDKQNIIRQRFPSVHSDGCEKKETKSHDLSGKHVLISESGNFHYFGRRALIIPKSLLYLVKKGSAHKCNFPKDIINDFLQWIQKKKTGINGYPYGFSLKRIKHGERCSRE